MGSENVRGFSIELRKFRVPQACGKPAQAFSEIYVRTTADTDANMVWHAIGVAGQDEGSVWRAQESGAKGIAIDAGSQARQTDQAGFGSDPG